MKKLIRIIIWITVSFIYSATILFSPKMDIVVGFLCILLGMFYLGIAFFVDDLFSPWGFLFIFQFLGYIDLTMVALGIENAKGVYSVDIFRTSFFIMFLWSIAFSIGMAKNWTFHKIDKRIDAQIKYDGNRINVSVILIPCLLLYLYAAFSSLKSSIALGGLRAGMLGGGNSFTNKGYLMTLLAFAGIIPVTFLYKKKYILAVICAIAICIGILLTGRRSLAITTAFLPFLVYWNHKIKKIRLNHILLLAIPIIFVVLYIGAIRTAKEVGFSTMNTDNSLIAGIALLGKYNGYGTNIPAMVYKIKSGALDFQHFKYSLRGIEYFIPRALWPSKPLVHSSEIVSNKVFFVGDTGRPVGPYGWAYFNFGFAGVFVSGLLTGQISQKFYRWAYSEGSMLSLSCYGMLMLSVLEIFQPEAQMKIILFSIVFYGLYILSTRTKLTNQ